MLRYHIFASQMVRTFAKWIGDGKARSFTKAFKKRFHMTASVCKAAILESEDPTNELARLKTIFWSREK